MLLFVLLIQYGCLSLGFFYVQEGGWTQGQQPLHTHRSRTVEASIRVFNIVCCVLKLHESYLHLKIMDVSVVIQFWLCLRWYLTCWIRIVSMYVHVFYLLLRVNHVIHMHMRAYRDLGHVVTKVIQLRSPSCKWRANHTHISWNVGIGHSSPSWRWWAKIPIPVEYRQLIPVPVGTGMGILRRSYYPAYR